MGALSSRRLLCALALALGWQLLPGCSKTRGTGSRSDVDVTHTAPGAPDSSTTPPEEDTKTVPDTGAPRPSNVPGGGRVGDAATPDTGKAPEAGPGPPRSDASDASPLPRCDAGCSDPAACEGEGSGDCVDAGTRGGDGGCGPDGNCRDAGAECGTCEEAPQEDAGCLPSRCAEMVWECGLVNDGCGGVVDCGRCANGEQCGLLQAYLCDPVPPECPPLTPEAACSGRECGQVFDGCGDRPENVIDCSEVTGGCPSDELCGVLVPFQCDAAP
jgi:hypothetical protein